MDACSPQKKNYRAGLDFILCRSGFLKSLEDLHEKKTAVQWKKKMLFDVCFSSRRNSQKIKGATTPFFFFSFVLFSIPKLVWSWWSIPWGWCLGCQEWNRATLEVTAPLNLCLAITDGSSCHAWLPRLSTGKAEETQQSLRPGAAGKEA